VSKLSYFIPVRQQIGDQTNSHRSHKLPVKLSVQ